MHFVSLELIYVLDTESLTNSDNACPSGIYNPLGRKGKNRLKKYAEGVLSDREY